MAIYSTLFFSGSMTPPGSYPLFTTPATGYVVVLRDILLVSDCIGPVKAGLYVSGSTEPLWVPRITGNPTPFPAQRDHEELRQVLAAGVTLTWQFQAVVGTMHLALSGYKLAA